LFATQDEVSCPSCHKLHISNGKNIVIRCFSIGIAAELLTFVICGFVFDNWWYALALSLSAIGGIGAGAYLMGASPLYRTHSYWPICEMISNSTIQSGRKIGAADFRR
jgi:hypothetical protein